MLFKNTLALTAATLTFGSAAMADDHAGVMGYALADDGSTLVTMADIAMPGNVETHALETPLRAIAYRPVTGQLLGYADGMILAGRLADRFNPVLLSTLGLALLLAGLLALALVPDGAGIVDILWRTALCGLGFGFFQAPNNREMMSSVPRARSNNASGMMSTTRTIGQSLGVALVGVFLALGAGSVQASLWLGCGACALAVAVSLRRIRLVPEARTSLAERASPERD